MNDSRVFSVIWSPEFRNAIITKIGTIRVDARTKIFTSNNINNSEFHPAEIKVI